MALQYRCKNKRRLQTVLTQAGADGRFLNGIDYLEVSSDHKTLNVHLLHSLPPTLLLTPENVTIAGGVRRMVSVTSVSAADKLLTVRVAAPGDFSTYTLKLVRSQTDPTPPDPFDPQLSQVDFAFWVESFSEFDCQTLDDAAEKKPLPPVIDYLAKDYASFRQLMLDRLAVTMPEWKERSPADIGIMLVELLAYAADQLSYYQDAVATEAYLETARRRISVRRHARLLDYVMHNGSNARAWVWIEVDPNWESAIFLPRPSLQNPSVRLFTRLDGLEPVVDAEALEPARNEGVQIFEPLHEVILHACCNEIEFYTWGDEQCELPKAATRATFIKTPKLLREHLVNAVLLFEEIRGRTTGLSAEADPTHRHVVRVTQVREQRDPLFGVDIFEVEWHPDDALPFPLYVGKVKINDQLKSVSVARGNMVLVDHGYSLSEELPEVPLRDRYRPQLQARPLTQQGRVRNADNQWVAYDSQASAQATFGWQMRDVKPVIELREIENSQQIWYPQQDLLNSDRFAKEFVAETEDDGRVYLRFGDGRLGKRPAPRTKFLATYRVGNGQIGNVGAEAIAHIFTEHLGIRRVRNPLPAQGGQDPEPIEQVKLYAPHAFREQQRAVTTADYAEVAQRFPDVQRAIATRRWTGSWYTIIVTVDRKGGREIDQPFKEELLRFLRQFRMAGHDLAIDTPRFVPLDIAMTVAVKSDYFASTVKTVLNNVFSNRVLNSGELGFFHPDNFTFGQSVYLSPMIAKAMNLPGVESVNVTRFQRWQQSITSGLETGEIPMERLEIARVDNDPTTPENGRIEFTMGGGL
jgi:Baseplate J-like protein